MIDLYKPFMPSLPLLDEILHSGRLTYGKYCRAFEKRLQQYFDTPYVMVTNSFNTAISVAVTALGLDHGDEIIASPMACLASTQPYLTSGLKVCWADVHPETGTLDPQSVRDRITSKTRCIVHNHFCGYPGDIEGINAIGQEFGIPVIDDGIECFGSLYRERKLGNCGTPVTVFSLTAVRNPSTIDGGVVIFQNREMFEKAVLIRDCGIDRTRFRDELGEIDPTCDIALKGYSATMCEVNGYIGFIQMEYIEELHRISRANAEKWNKHLAGRKDVKPILCADGQPNYWVFGTMVEEKQSQLREFRRLGYYASGVHSNNSLYSAFGKDTMPLPGAKEFAAHFLALPCGWWVNDI